MKTAPTQPPPTLTLTATLVTATPPPTLTPSPSAVPASETLEATATSTAIPSSEPFTVLLHPDDRLYVGDQVSLEVVSPPGLDLHGASVRLQIDPPQGPSTGAVNFGAWGLQGRDEAGLLWAWDTRSEQAGIHTLTFTVQPQGYTWTEQVTLLPASDLPAAQQQAHWASTQTACCTVFYITHTAAERDLATLTAQIDQQAKLAIDEMGANFTQPITITLLPRLLGHGGFTSDEISVSYLDRNYAATSVMTVIHHEMIHAIDGHLGGDFRPTLFVEGLAVYMTGGHYKPEPLLPRAAALLPAHLNWYIPLPSLADDFYASQHEIGYLEAASLIQYMVAAYGWPAFSAFYRDIHLQQGEKQSEAIDNALKIHFSIPFAQLEQGYLTALAQQANTAAWVEDVRLTVTYFDTMRRYQQLLDPSAYFRTAWLLDNKTMRQRGIVADYSRHPSTPVNLALETMFIRAANQMSDHDFNSASQVLQDISTVLDGIERATSDPFSSSEMASDYYTIASTLLGMGAEVQHVTVIGDTAQVEVSYPTGPLLVQKNLHRQGGEWVVNP